MKPPIQYCFLSLLLMYSCAQQVAPTGGPKDMVAPKITGSEPLNFSTNFTGNRIKIEFDEYIRQSNISNEMIITPTFEEQPEVKFKSKSVELIFKDSLKTSTTYTVNFGEGIVDLNENNPLDSNIFVFSTGDYLDSLSVQGIVKNALDLQPQEDVLVMLYDDLADSVPHIRKPTYFAKTDKSGHYRMGYIKHGNYKVFALKDANANYLFDQPEEPIAFRIEPVNPAITDTVDLALFSEDVKQQYLKKAYAVHHGQILFIFNQPATNAKALPVKRQFEKQWYIEELFKNKDTLCYWLTDTAGIDTLTFQVWDNDSVLDTVEVAIPARNAKPKGKLRKKQVEFKLATRSNLVKGPALDIDKTFTLKFSHPIKEADVSKILFTEKDDTLKATGELIDEARRKFRMNHEWKQNTRYRFFAPPGTFTDIFGLKNDTLDWKFAVKSPEDYGTLSLKVSLPDTGRYVVQLLNQKEAVISEKPIEKTETILYGNMQPDACKLKLIYDANGNGKWDTGDYSEKRQPEKVIFYSGKVQVRANWDLELEWEVE